VPGDFVWRDAGRLVVFRHGALAAAPELLAAHGIAEFELVSTPRARAAAPDLATAAAAVHDVPPGQVPDLAADLLGESGVLVALGGGRVIDTAKAVASVTGATVVAVPTTLSGAEMTAIHRLPAGAESRVRGMVRPALVLADPEAMTGQPEGQLRASAMNALAHGADSLYTPLSNPASEQLALRGAAEIAAALDQDREGRDRAALALGSLLCGYAIDSAGFGLHHVVCQTLVRICGTPHAETNATILPHALEFLANQTPADFAPLAESLNTDLSALPQRIRTLAGHPPGLQALGADPSKLDQAIQAILQRPELTQAPTPPSKQELTELLRAAW